MQRKSKATGLTSRSDPNESSGGRSGGRLVDARPSTFSHLGRNDELYNFDEYLGEEKQVVNRPAIPAKALLSRLARSSHKPLSFAPTKRKVVIPEPPAAALAQPSTSTSSAGAASNVFDFLGSIMQKQDLLRKGSKHVIINRDGSLKPAEVSVPVKPPTKKPESSSSASTSSFYPKDASGSSSSKLYDSQQQSPSSSSLQSKSASSASHHSLKRQSSSHFSSPKLSSPFLSSPHISSPRLSSPFLDEEEYNPASEPDTPPPSKQHSRSHGDANGRHSTNQPNGRHSSGQPNGRQRLSADSDMNGRSSTSGRSTSIKRSSLDGSSNRSPSFSDDDMQETKKDMQETKKKKRKHDDDDADDDDKRREKARKKEKVKKGFKHLVEDAVKSSLSTAWGLKKITKEEYKDIFKKSVEKVTLSKETVVNQDKIKGLVEAYIIKAKKKRLAKKASEKD